MSKKKIEGLGSQAVNKFFEQPATEQEEQGLPQVPRSNMGRPRTIYREYDKTSQEGLREGYTRATFIVREDLLKKLKDYAYTERETLKDVVNYMIAQFLEGKEIIEREDK
jgi:hypothetical protein